MWTSYSKNATWKMVASQSKVVVAFNEASGKQIFDVYRQNIIDMLEALPGAIPRMYGGWSFLNSCDDKNGRQWTGLHSTMERLWCRVHSHRQI